MKTGMKQLLMSGVASLLAIGFAVMPTAAAAPVTSVSPDFACSSLCFYQSTSYSHDHKQYTKTQVSDNAGKWMKIPDAEKGSVSNQTTRNISVYNKGIGIHKVIASSSRSNLGDSYGWWCTGTWSACKANRP